MNQCLFYKPVYNILQGFWIVLGRCKEVILYQNIKISFFLTFYFVYLFLTLLGLHCCVRAFPSCSEQGLLFVAVCGLPIAVASLVMEHGIQACKLQ